MAITPPGLATLAPRLAPSTALLRGSGRGRARSRDPRSLHARVRLEGDGLPGQLARVRDPVTIGALACLVSIGHPGLRGVAQIDKKGRNPGDRGSSGK